MSKNKDSNKTIIDAGKTRDFTDYSEDAIALAESRRPIVESILTKRGRTKADVEKAGAVLGITGRQMYSIMNAYEADPCIGTLIGAKRGRKSGTRLLDPRVEALITDAIEGKYKDKTRRDVFYIVRHIHAKCDASGLRKPAVNTIKTRIRALNDREVDLKREGYKVARDRHSAINEGLAMPRFVLDCVMIDHTKADVIVVDEESRLPIGRPFLTLAIDVRSRAIVAMVLRLAAPSALTSGLALHMCSIPKDKYISKLDIDTVWEMHGIPRKLSLDNGADFRSKALRFGCEQNLIDLDHRPVAHPTMGGIVERAIQTINRETHQLPGTTKGDVISRRGYNAEQHACMTLRDLERYLVLFITRQYHERIHKGIGMSPRRAWEEGLAGGEIIVPTIRTPKDPRRFLIDFLPYKELTIGRKGFNYLGTYYNDDTLTSLRLRDGKRKYVVRRDPRSVSRVFAYVDSLNPPRYLEIGPSDRNLPDISEEELDKRRAKAKRDAMLGINQGSIHSAHLEAEEIVEDAQKLKKSARKYNSRRKQNIKSVKATPTARPDSLPNPENVEVKKNKFDPESLAEFLDDGFEGIDPS